MKRIVFLLLLVNLFVNAQETFTLDAIQNHFLQQMALFPQEKIHVHTDRQMYIPGERIWFKVYVVDAFLHLSPTYSQYAYIELINSSDSLIHRVMVTLDENKLLHGYIFLSELIPEGDYTLRAYTRYIENQGDDYFFKKNIHIGNLISQNRTSLDKENINRIRADYDVTFYPEGGNLPEGITSRVAFKALNQQGTSEVITGSIVDKGGNRVVSDIRTVYAGMGSFSFVPEQQQEYYLLSKSSGGQEKRFRLPTAQKTFSVSTSYRNSRHFIQVNKSPDIPEQPLYLLVHCKGEIFYFDSWYYQGEFISFSVDQLPSGIIQVVLFDEQMNPISERLIFNKNEEQTQFVFSTDKPYYSTREKVTSEIFLTDMDGITLAGNLSIAITDNTDIAIDSLNTITSSLLLTSELRGSIESPSYYLRNDRNAEYALDHLMMTHGWRRYNIAEVVKGIYMHPTTEYELAKQITGKVQTPLLARPVANGEVSYFSNDGEYDDTVTSSEGIFNFALHYADSTQFFIQSKNQRGREGVEIIVYPEQFPKVKYAPQSLSLLPPEMEQGNSFSDNTIDFLKKAEQRALYDDDVRVINLEEVVISAKRIEKRDEIRLMNPINALSSMTVYRETSEYNHTASNVTNLLYGISGVTIRPDGKIFLRRADESLIGEGPEPLPIVLIDGMRMDWDDTLYTIWDSPLEKVNINDVETIDIFIGGKAAIFGAGSSGGAISITTKKPNLNIDRTEGTNTTFIAPLGYQKPVEFYAPKYDTPEMRLFSIPDYRTTIFWKPDLIVSDYGKASFEFYTADFPTTYSVVIEGLSEEGDIIRHIETIEVK